jgi:predicted outer membrane protein
MTFALLLAAAPLAAQERQVERQPTRTADRGAAVSLRDQELAHCLINANRNEVEVAKFASEKLQSAEAKQFAQMLIEDHTKGLQTFGKYDPSARVASERTTTVIDRDRPAAPDRDRPATRPAPRTTERPVTTADAGVSKAGLNWRQISDELAAKCLDSAKKELSSKQGIEFEKCFLGMQVAAHMKMRDELTVFQKHASDELAADIGKALETTEHHLAMAKKLMEQKKDIEPGETKTTTRKPTGTRTRRNS